MRVRPDLHFFSPHARSISPAVCVLTVSAVLLGCSSSDPIITTAPSSTAPSSSVPATVEDAPDDTSEAGDSDEIELTTDVVAWGSSSDLVDDTLRERDLTDSDGWLEVDRTDFDDELVLAFTAEVTNLSTDLLVLYGPESDSLGLPSVFDDTTPPRLLLSNQYPDVVDFDQQPLVSGTFLEPGETIRLVFTLPYPLDPDWSSADPIETDEVEFCVGLTDNVDGGTVYEERRPSGRLWPADTDPADIEACQLLSR